MRVEVDANLIAYNLKNVAYIVSEFKGDSVLGRMLIKALNDKITFSLVGICDRAIIDIPCKVLEAGELCIDANKFIGIIQSFDGNVTIHSTVSKVFIQQNSVKVSLQLFECKEFDGLTINSTFEECGNLPSNLLERCINIVSPWIETKDKGVLGGLHLKLKDKILTTYGCNQAAAGITNNIINNKATFAFTVKTQALHAASRLFKDEDIKLSLSSSSVCFEGEYCKLYTHLMQGQYPPIEKILQIESQKTSTLSIDRSALEKCLKRLFVLKTLDKRFTMSIENNNMTVTYDNVLQENIDIECEVENIKIAVNYEYLSNILKICNNKQIDMKISTNNNIIYNGEDFVIMIARIGK